MAKKREEIDNNYKWDLSSIYKDLNEFNKDLKDAEEKIKEIEKYKDNFMDDENILYEFLSFIEDLERKLEKLYMYAHLNFDSDTTNTTYQELFGKVKNIFTLYSFISSFVSPNMIKYDYSVIEDYMSKNKNLKKYEKEIKDIFKYKDHTLSLKEEELLSTFGNVLSSGEDIFSYLTDSDIRFGTIKDEDDKEVELTESNFSVYRTSKVRRVRKDSFEGIFSTYSNYKNTISACFASNVEALCRLAKVRGFSSSIEASLFDDDVEVKIYDNLIDVVSKNLKPLYKYYDEKRKILKLDDFHIYDAYANIVPSFDKKYSFEEAKKLTIEATKVLGEEYTKILNKEFDEKWVDIYPNKGKRTGAYSSGSYDTKPFILLNFEGKYNDVSTLAHESGHSVHSYLSRTNQDFYNSQYKIFVAEVASTVNELLLAKYMINNSKDKEEKLFILNNLLDLYKATIYRQVMFAEFEKYAHELFEKGEVLTSEVLEDKYYELNKKYFGDKVEIDDLIRYEWLRVPHFFYNFYVYKYAIGLSCASHIVNNILSGKEGAKENYIKFLSSGGSKTPIELLKIADCDLTKGEVIQSAIDMFEELLDETLKLIKEGD